MSSSLTAGFRITARPQLFTLAALSIALCHPAAAQVAILQIQVTGGEGAVQAPGSRDSRGISVVVTDETGRPVEGAVVSFHLPDQGPSGTFVNGLHTEVAVTDDRGRAAVRAIEFNRVPGRFEIRMVASKEQARAGTVTFQYIAGTSPGAAAAAPAKGGRHHRKIWLMVAVAAGAGAAGGAVAMTRASPANATAASATVLSIGPPSITVSKP
ncbi:MAG: carboxypeptidase-like regulatory domain-containing protein [Bryobacteraceae bacterium]